MKFIRRVVRATKEKIVSFFKDCVEHTEAVALLVAASFGVNAAISIATTTTAGKIIVLPAFLEPMMVIPVLSVLTVLGLVKLAEWRSIRRNPVLQYL